MRLALIADTFPPFRSSGAVQLRDLAREFAAQGHALTVMLPSADIEEKWSIEDYDGATVVRLKAPKTKDIGYVRRTFAEFAMPFAMLRNLRASPISLSGWDGVIWYSPSIFHGPLARKLKRASGCGAYLIIRDIFPDWAVDMGLMRRGPAYYFLSMIAHFQYSVADVIGVQTEGNRVYLDRWLRKPGREMETLQNWLGAAQPISSSIRPAETRLKGRKIFVYAGNMGVAQGLDIIMELACALRHRDDVGFLFVGRGSEAERLASIAQERALENVLFFDEVEPDEIPDLYAQCSAGIVALDHRHKSHNIPGKFLTYMQSGLPVLANVNSGNDLAALIRKHDLGQVCESNSLVALIEHAERLLIQLDFDDNIGKRCHQIFEHNYSVKRAVEQIVAALSHNEAPK